MPITDGLFKRKIGSTIASAFEMDLSFRLKNGHSIVLFPQTLKVCWKQSRLVEMKELS